MGNARLKLANESFVSYEQYAGCTSCHGNKGHGEIEGVALDPPAPNLTDCDFNSREPRRD